MPPTAYLPADTLAWGLALIFGFPVAILVLGELAVSLRRRRNPLAATVAEVRILLLPTLALYALMTRILVYPTDSVPVKVVETAFWLVAIHTALVFVNDVLFAAALDESWQARVPKLLRDLIRLFLVLVGGAIVLSKVWSLDLGAVVTALGVGSIVIGLALQEPLGNVFAGIMLMFERPFAPGDWIQVQGNNGRVIEINWRAVHLQTLTDELIVVPNSVLAKEAFRNHARPTRVNTQVLKLGFSYDDPPNKVKAVLRDAIARSAGVLPEPAPRVRATNYGDFAIDYEVEYRVATFEDAQPSRDDFLTRIWYACRRNGLTIPYPTQTSIEVGLDEVTQAARRAADPVALLEPFAHFRVADDEARLRLPEHATVRDYAAGEVVVAEGSRLDGLHLVTRGKAELTVATAAGRPQRLDVVERGAYFGETSLGGEPSELTVTALEDLTVVVLDRDGLGLLLERSPQLAREMGGLIDVRRQAAQAARRVKPDRRRPTVRRA
jgi:small-conductance mechanosensitive channel/CRP-like cAMP-binding protein